jgi:N-acetylmuramoyl-L-alanine amidase
MLVCIDAGHAESTAGKRSFDGSLREYEFNRAVAKLLKYQLERHGVKTMYSCDIETDKDISLSERCKAANNAKADLFISIHANAYGTGWNSANGWEIFHHENSANGKRLAEAIHNANEPHKGKLQFLGLTDRGIKTNTFTVLTNTAMPAVLIEHGFYTNLEECAMLKSTEFRKKCAIADAKGTLNYLGIAWKEDTAETPINDEIEILKNKVGLADETIKYLQNYKYGKELVSKIAKAVK